MKKITITSSDPLSTFHAQARLLADVLKDAGVADDVQILDSTGSVINAERTSAGTADLGFMASNWVPRAVAGLDPFTVPLEIAIVTPLNAGPLFFVAPADSPLNSVRELKGKPVAVGHADSGMAQHAANIAKVLGWQGDDVAFSHISTFDGGAALANGSVVAQFSAPIPSVHFTNLCDAMPVKVLEFDPSDIEALCAAHPFYSPALVPAAFVPGLERDMPALGVLNVVVTKASAPDAFVGAVARAFIEGAAGLEQAHALFRGLPEQLARAREHGVAALAPGGAPLHPAAAEAFKDAGLLV
ncbi:MAG: TRAP transporter TAXI family solute receptor [Alphaproteobacteria bacterium]|jgi:TRAP transporter TAXI family solute receptor